MKHTGVWTRTLLCCLAAAMLLSFAACNPESGEQESTEATIEAMTAHAAIHDPHVRIFDKASKMYPFLKETGKRDSKFGSRMMAYWEEAYAMAETDDQRAHVEKSSIQVYYLCSLEGNTVCVRII